MAAVIELGKASDREAQTFGLVIEGGLSRSDAARQMGVTVETVKTWLKRLRKKAKAVALAQSVEALIDLEKAHEQR